MQNTQRAVKAARVLEVHEARFLTNVLISRPLVLFLVTLHSAKFLWISGRKTLPLLTVCAALKPAGCRSVSFLRAPELTKPAAHRSPARSHPQPSFLPASLVTLLVPPPFPFPHSGVSTNPLFSTVSGHVRAARPRSSHASPSADRGGTGSPASSGLTPARALVWRRERCTKECSGTPRHYKTARTLLNKTATLIKSG